jgi:hypothetical protein
MLTLCRDKYTVVILLHSKIPTAKAGVSLFPAMMFTVAVVLLFCTLENQLSGKVSISPVIYYLIMNTTLKRSPPLPQQMCPYVCLFITDRKY